MKNKCAPRAFGSAEYIETGSVQPDSMDALDSKLYQRR